MAQLVQSLLTAAHPRPRLGCRVRGSRRPRVEWRKLYDAAGLGGEAAAQMQAAARQASCSRPVLSGAVGLDGWAIMTSVLIWIAGVDGAGSGLACKSCVSGDAW